VDIRFVLQSIFQNLVLRVGRDFTPQFCMDAERTSESEQPMSLNSNPSLHGSSLSGFRPVRYQPDGDFELNSAAATLLVGAVAGAACGFCASLGGYYGFYLVLLTPLVIGLGVGMSMSKSVTITKNRNPWVTAVAAVIASLVAVTAVHASNYAFFQNDLKQVPAEELEIAMVMKDYAQRGEILPLRLQDLPADEEERQYWKWLQVESFGEYLQMEAEVGISFSKVTMPNSGMNIGFTGTIIYWLFESLMIASVATGLVWKASSKPFCVECDQWCHEKHLGELSVNSQRVKTLLENGRIDSLSRELPGH